MMIKKLCLNYLGGPSSGKSVAASNIFTQLKKLHINCELVAEFPKDLVLENNNVALADQIYVFSGQLYRLRCAYDNTDVAIVDSPLLLSAIYNPDTSIHLINLIFEQFNKFNNLNIMVRRKDYPHSMSGRIHSLTESVSIDNQIIRLLEAHSIPFIYDDEITDEELIEYILTQTKSDDEL